MFASRWLAGPACKWGAKLFLWGEQSAPVDVRDTAIRAHVEAQVPRGYHSVKRPLAGLCSVAVVVYHSLVSSPRLLSISSRTEFSSFLRYSVPLNHWLVPNAYRTIHNASSEA